MNPLDNPRYQCIQEVGHGSFGIVYKAYDTRLKREVAIKKLVHHETYELQSLQYLAHLSHPGLVRIIDVINADCEYYIIMDFIEGQNLLQWYELGHTFSIKEGYVFLVEMLDVLAFLHHQAGLVYNDLKPENIQRLPSGHFILLDFGTCFPINQQPNHRYGSKAFASTEYLEGKNVDGRSDLYSLAKTFSVLANQKTLRYYKRWINKCLNNNPQKRYKNVKVARNRLSLYQIKKRIGLILVLSGSMLIGNLNHFRRQLYYYFINEELYTQAIQLDKKEKIGYLKYYEQLDKQAIEEFIYLDLSYLKEHELIFKLIEESIQQKKRTYAKHFISYLDDEKQRIYYEALLIENEQELQRYLLQHCGIEGLVEVMIRKLNLNDAKNIEFIHRFQFDDADYERLYLQIFDVNILKELRNTQTNKELQSILEIQLFYSGEYQHNHLHQALNLTSNQKRKEVILDLIEQWGEKS